MKKLIAIVISSILIFDSTGYCLRVPIGIRPISREERQKIYYDEILKMNTANIKGRDNRIKGIRNIFQDTDIRLYFDTKGLNRYFNLKKETTFDNRWSTPIPRPLLMLFIDDVFNKALMHPEYRENSRIVFLKAGAHPLYEVAKVRTQVIKDFPESRIHSIWATMANSWAMNDPLTGFEQKVLFIKYLVDQGILTPDTKKIIFVDTDSRTSGDGSLGTEVIIYDTLLNKEVIDAANKRFGLNLEVWNSGIGYEAEVFYMYLHGIEEGVVVNLKRDISEIDYMERMKVSGMNQSEHELRRFASRALWRLIDKVTKIENIKPSFRLNIATGKVETILAPVYCQERSEIKRLISYYLEIAGLVMGALDVLEARGYDVTDVSEEYLKRLENELRSSITYLIGYFIRKLSAIPVDVSL